MLPARMAKPGRSRSAYGVHPADDLIHAHAANGLAGLLLGRCYRCQVRE